jgi:hypothetical protein
MLKWGFDRSYEVARIGLSGGLAFGWNDSWIVSILYSSPHFIHTEITYPLGNLASITFIYGHPVLSHRNQIWEELYHLGAQIQHSWLCIGDFNQVIFEEESSLSKFLPLQVTTIYLIHCPLLLSCPLMQKASHSLG